MKRILQIDTGDTFGDLVCIGSKIRTNPNGSHSTVYIMRCNKCGRVKEMLSSTVRIGHGITHKACGRGIKLQCKTFYDRWQAMRTRTTNANYHAAKDYSKRGINSDEFALFIDFYDAMFVDFKILADRIGERNVSLERIDCNKSYTRDNCIWIDKHCQQQNTRKTLVAIITYPNGTAMYCSKIRHFSKHRNFPYESVHDAVLRNGVYKEYSFHNISV